MARRIEEEIGQLARLCEAGPTPAAIAAVRKALSDRVGLMVAKGAKLAAQMQRQELIPDLLRAFDRLFEKPLERDPQCWAKNAIAGALTDLQHRESAAFLRGARHIQLEPVWGIGSTGVYGKEDTATTLRGICLLALVTCNDLRREEILRYLVDGLAEPHQNIRVECVRALAQMEGDEPPLLLRLKARLGDSELPVIGQVFDSLLRLEGQAAVEFLERFLGAPDEVREEAALALGACRLPGSLEALQAAWQLTHDPEFRRVLLRAISASRQEPAFEFLLDLVRNSRPRDAGAALEALLLHKESPEIRRRIEQAAGEGGTAIEQQFRELFP